jgi:hypothetical protein
MTKREGISRVKIGVKELNADSKLSNKYVWSIINSKTKLLIQRDSDNLNLSRLQNLYQSLSCVQMEEAPAGDTCCDVRTYCTVFRSVDRLPELYTDSYGVIISGVTTIDGSIEVKMTTPQQVLRTKKDTNSKYDKTIYGFYKDGYVYITNESYPLISIEGMFVDDVRLSLTNSCRNTLECLSYMDTDWIVPSKMEEPIIAMCIQELAGVYKKIPEDNNINKNPNI